MPALHLTAEPGKGRNAVRVVSEGEKGEVKVSIADTGNITRGQAQQCLRAIADRLTGIDWPRT